VTNEQAKKIAHKKFGKGAFVYYISYAKKQKDRYCVGRDGKDYTSVYYNGPSYEEAFKNAGVEL